MSQGYSFYHFWVIKGKPKRMGGGGGGDGKITTTTKIRVKILFLSYVISGGVINSRFF